MVAVESDIVEGSTKGISSLLSQKSWKRIIGNRYQRCRTLKISTTMRFTIQKK